MVRQVQPLTAGAALAGVPNGSTQAVLLTMAAAPSKAWTTITLAHKCKVHRGTSAKALGWLLDNKYAEWTGTYVASARSYRLDDDGLALAELVRVPEEAVPVEVRMPASLSLSEDQIVQIVQAEVDRRLGDLALGVTCIAAGLLLAALALTDSLGE